MSYTNIWFGTVRAVFVVINTPLLALMKRQSVRHVKLPKYFGQTGAKLNRETPFRARTHHSQITITN